MRIDNGEGAVLLVAVVLYAIAGVLALLASIGVGALGPFQTAELALAFVAAGLVACHVPPSRVHV